MKLEEYLARTGPVLTLKGLLDWKEPRWNEYSNTKKLDKLPGLFWYLGRSINNVVDGPGFVKQDGTAPYYEEPIEQLRLTRHIIAENSTILLDLVNEFISIQIAIKKESQI